MLKVCWWGLGYLLWGLLILFVSKVDEHNSSQAEVVFFEHGVVAHWPGQGRPLNSARMSVHCCLSKMDGYSP
ncbi:hypothetical protein P2G88_07490 [Aliiglaciecola sp. CAU 1673]|uniref:hypothetical protein n=1 Tax=Aliiglaciecola sp. CAU 1673 TaxID=3032595 RepID=UPI0023DBC966|nr:hypothetical protein [Aliiglaciecola sp. CAU 1673]MDF2178094.1 hypothetical protein [Aliiglaciecola sp. CAU 1673]